MNLNEPPEPNDITIVVAKSFDEVDKAKFAALVKSGFNKPLIPDYFSFTKPAYICLAKYQTNYAGAIVVEHIPNLEGVSYLDKIVVSPHYWGRGIGKNLWRNLNGASEKAIWRAKKENPIVNFYKLKSDGCINLTDVKDFMFFYYGLSSEELTKALSYAVGKKPSLIEPTSKAQQPKGGK